jgi:endonuclease/exonuclease/phosphatase family metal-dependent hydrolase
MKHLSRALFMMALLPVTACVVGDEGDEDDDLLIEKGNFANVRIIQHNIEKRQNVLQATINKAMAINADGVALQELCPSQTAWLQSTYAGKNWTIGVAPGKKPAGSGCPLPDGTQDKPQSVVIWMNGKGGKVDDYSLQISNPSNAPGQLVCVKAEKAGVPVHFCSAHLISAKWTDPNTGTVYPGDVIRQQQTTHIKQLARDTWFAGNKNHFGIVAGDFNGKPNTDPLLKMYDNKLGGTGEFTEYNRSGGSRDGQTTAMTDDDNEAGMVFKKKIDYVFFSTNRAAIDGPAVDIIPDDSDHDMVISTAKMRK